MRPRPSAIFLAVALGAAPGPILAQEATAAAQGYVCHVEAGGPFGWIHVVSSIGWDGTRYPPQARWTSPARNPGLSLDLNWTGNPLGPPGDDAAAALTFSTGARRAGRARIELRRGALPWHPDELVFSNRFMRRPAGVLGQARWGDLRLLMQGAASLQATVVRENGSVVARDRIEAAWLDKPAQAVAAVRPAYDAAMADPEERCSPQPDDAEI